MSASQILFMFLTVYCTAEAGLGLVAPREGRPNLGNALHFGPHLPRSHVDHFCPVSIYFSVLEDSFFEHLHRSHVDRGPGHCFLSHFNLLFCFWPKYFYNTEEWLLSPYLFSDHSCAMWQNEWANEWPAHVTLFSQEIIPKWTVINWIWNLTLTFLFPFTSFESSLAGRSLTITLHIFTHSPLALARLRQQFGISAGLFLACLLFLIIFKLNKNEFNLIELNLI